MHASRPMASRTFMNRDDSICDEPIVGLVIVAMPSACGYVGFPLNRQLGERRTLFGAGAHSPLYRSYSRERESP